MPSLRTNKRGVCVVLWAFTYERTRAVIQFSEPSYNFHPDACEQSARGVPFGTMFSELCTRVKAGSPVHSYEFIRDSRDNERSKQKQSVGASRLTLKHTMLRLESARMAQGEFLPSQVA